VCARRSGGACRSRPAALAGPRPRPPVAQGFRAQDPEVDDIVRAARDLCACSVAPDAAAPPDESVEVLLRALRLVQLGMEVQVADNDGLLREANALREDVKVRAPPAGSARPPCQVARQPPTPLGVATSPAAAPRHDASAPAAVGAPCRAAARPQSLEDTNRALEEEIGELRQLRDAAEEAGDVRDMQRELRVRRAWRPCGGLWTAERSAAGRRRLCLRGREPRAGRGCAVCGQHGPD
jgi:hypothetical protein